MTVREATTKEVPHFIPSPPPLESGDRLTRREFERRYEAMPQARAELVEGVVYMASPVRVSHGTAHASVVTWLAAYSQATPGVQLCLDTTVRLDADNEVQPDVLLRIAPEAGGMSRISADDYVEGAPDLVIEVALSSASYDLHDKRNAYRRNRVREYVVWQVYERRLNWFWLHEGDYTALPPNEQGILQSRVFPGLWLDGAALLAGDMAAVQAAVRQGCATDQHTAFVRRLGEQGLDNEQDRG